MNKNNKTFGSEFEFRKISDLEKFRALNKNRFKSLSKQEIRILGFIAHEIEASEIADKTGITTRSIQIKLKRIHQKLSIKNHSDYIKYALAFGLMKF